MQLGEPISIGLFVGDDVQHSESTCPWHSKKTASAKPMDAQDGDEDAHGKMPDNSGKKLGTAMTRAKNAQPAGKTVSVYYEQGSVFKYPDGKKKKTLRIYEESVDEEEYDL